MFGVEIRDTDDRNVLSFDVRTILALVDGDALRSEWKCRNTECLGEKANRVHEIDDKGLRISGEQFIEIMNDVYQTIDGRFEAFKRDNVGPWLVIKAVDSSLFEVWSVDDATIQKVEQAFLKVRRLSPDQL